MLPVDSVSNINEADLFTNLPQEIIIDILSRLPVGTITTCKCVCKPWHDLIKSSEFVATHLASNSTSGLALIERSMAAPCKICTEVGVDGCTRISNFVLPTPPWPTHCTTELCSANGLILFFDRREAAHNPFICNPITREYMEFPPPPGYQPCEAVFGFGASKISGQYKIVVIFNKCCMVYTLGTGLWRSIATIKNIQENGGGGFAATLMNGNLHWLGLDMYDGKSIIFPVLIIYCLDLETEQCTSFDFPPHCDEDWFLCDGGYRVSVLEGRLSFCYRVYSKITIWLMNKYGDESSWTKEFVMIARVPSEFLFPLKIFRDKGVILFGANRSRKLFFYSNKSKSYQVYGHLQVEACRYNSSSVVAYTPSFLSLKTMGFQNVVSF